jgi:hypothetical protein
MDLCFLESMSLSVQCRRTELPCVIVLILTLLVLILIMKLCHVEGSSILLHGLSSIYSCHCMPLQGIVISPLRRRPASTAPYHSTPCLCLACMWHTITSTAWCHIFSSHVAHHFSTTCHFSLFHTYPHLHFQLSINMTQHGLKMTTHG